MIEISNNDTRPAWGIRIWDTLPAGLVFGGSYASVQPSVSGNYVLWELPADFELKPGEKIFLELDAKIADMAAVGPLINTVSADYNDNHYSGPAGRHPAISSQAMEFPLSEVVAFPNPFIASESFDGTIKFANVAPGSTISIYTLSGEFVVTIQPAASRPKWDLKNKNNRQVSAGVYFYVIRNNFSGQILKGKLFVVGY